MTVDALIKRLAGVRKSGKGWVSRCPPHDDQHASLSVSTGDDGRILLRCHAGCETAAIACMRVPHDPGLTKGEAADLMTAAIARRIA